MTIQHRGRALTAVSPIKREWAKRRRYVFQQRCRIIAEVYAEYAKRDILITNMYSENELRKAITLEIEQRWIKTKIG